MIQILDTRINRYVELTPAEANTLNNVRELMLQAITWVKLGRQVNSYFVIARSYRDEFDEGAPAWNLCENAIRDASAQAYTFNEQRKRADSKMEFPPKSW